MQIHASIYNLADGATNQILKSYLSLGGIYHVGLEIAGIEWSYGYCESGSGIFAVEPRKCSLGPFHEQVSLGESNVSVDDVIRVLHKLRQDWMGADYNILSRNCVTFTQELIQQLSLGANLPAYATAMSGLGAAVSSVPHKRRKVDVSGLELFGSREKEFMWSEAERLMREFEKDGKLSSSSLQSGILHSHLPFPQPHSPLDTQAICAQSLYRIRDRNMADYMRFSGTRRLILNYRSLR